VLLSLLPQLLPLMLGGLLGWTGGAKLPRRRAARQAAGSALERILPSPWAAALALRAVGAMEVVLAATLLLRPLSQVAAFGTAALGVFFVGYLGYAKVTAPQSSCGCTSRRTPVTWRSIARAGLVAAGGVGCAFASVPWWSAAAHRPAAAAAVIFLAAVGFGIVSSDFDRLWLLPLRQARLRLFGHPLAGTSGEVPLAATVELLEASLAWQATAPIVRSALVDHWDSDGWRILRYSGVHDGPDGPRPVSVVFALDANATTETVRDPVVRVSVVDEERQQTVADPVLDVTRRPPQPMAKPRLAHP
jgi:Methylamine utilisation protein MauE